VSKAARKDVLDEMTKEDLVEWIRSQHFFMKPKKSEVLYLRWKRQSADIIAEMEKENRSLDHLDFGERDRLAKQFNATTDPNERLRLVEKIEPYDKALRDLLSRSEAINRKQKRMDALYDQIEVEQQKERRA
jgi:DNA polymerase III delta prime subunit